MNNRFEIDGIDAREVTRWFVENLSQAVPPFQFQVLAGGNSNLTFLVTDSRGGQFVLRRPPLNSVLATAHDMVREWRAISALQSTAVPVPPALGLCTDSAVNGAPFYVMGFVDGYVQHSLDISLAMSTPEQRRLTGHSMCDVLVDMHAVDIDAVGLGGHGPRGGYLDRQLKRWYAQYAATTTQEVGDVEYSYHRLLELLPPESDVTLVHGDYRLGNCITGPSGAIAAVLDWEISTLGDPLADLAYCLNTWARPDNNLGGLLDSRSAPTMADGFPSTAEFLDRYSERSGRDV
ncbi:MAG: phosphotransferase family protein, partial [Ilumatobacteraceae bacterium]